MAFALNNYMKQLFIASYLIFIFSSCAKKYDWKCTCEVYKADTTYTTFKELTHLSQTDANEQCAKFGESESGTNGAHDCNAQVK